MTFLNLFLISTLVLSIPLIFILRSSTLHHLNQTEAVTARNWIYFIIAILCLRALVGFLFVVGDFHHWSVGKFYPIRIASPNYGILAGLPYFIICLVFLVYIRSICNYIVSSQLRFLLIWIFSVVLLLSYGGIHGGFLAGNIGMSSSPDHIYDASINSTILDTFTSHGNRISGYLQPGFKTPHTISHPAGSLIIWQVMTKTFSPIWFSVINVMFFSLAFPVMYWALRRHESDKVAIQVVVCAMTIPALLVYGRSDDVIYYAFAAVIMAVSFISILERRYILTFLTGVLLAMAANISYASLILLPALLSFNTKKRVTSLWAHIRLVLPHTLIISTTVLLIVAIGQYYFGFSYIDHFKASVAHNADSNIVRLLHAGKFWVILNDRAMAISDFLIFGGPFLLFVFYKISREFTWDIPKWQIRNLALSVLMLVLVINSNGPGEVSRPWGSIYLMFGFVWFAEFFRIEDEKTSWRIIQSQLLWALILMATLNFGGW